MSKLARASLFALLAAVAVPAIAFSANATYDAGTDYDLPTAAPISTAKPHAAIGTSSMTVTVGTSAAKAVTIGTSAAKPVAVGTSAAIAVPSAATSAAATTTTTTTTTKAAEKPASEPAPAATAPVKTAAAEKATPSPDVNTPNGTSVTKITTSALSSKGVLDVYMTLTNNRPTPDAIMAAIAPAEKVVLVTVGKDGKETEVPFSIGFAGGAKVDLTKGEQFMRLYGLDKTVKPGDHFTIAFHFRSGPNVNISVGVGTGSKSSSSFFGFGSDDQ